MIEAAIRSILIKDPFVSQIVGERVYFVMAPQNEGQRAHLILQLVSSTPGRTYEGRSDWTQGTMEITCLASTYPAAKALFKAVSDALDEFEGTEGDTHIDYIELSESRDVPTGQPLEGRPAPMYGVQIDAEFMYHE
ncbi:MAG: tail completion protein gp17 [Bacillota bacterium]